MNRFLVDESCGIKLYQSLLENNYDVESVTNVMPRALDIEILDYADKENRILITNDKDFGELVFRLKMPSFGVIFLRLRKNIPKYRIKYTLHVIKQFSEKLAHNFIIVSERKIRIRSLK